MASTTIPEKFLPVLTDKKAFAHLGTLMPDGSPQVTPVWFFYKDGKFVVNTARGRVKDRNMSKNALVALSITDPDNPYSHIAVRGKVVKTTEAGADANIDAMAKKYMGDDKYPYRQPGEVRVMYEIEPVSVSSDGLRPVYDRALDGAAQGEPLSDTAALALADSEPTGAVRAAAVRAAACAARDAAFGQVVTYSPKVFLPLTNLCRNRCDYCSFRRSPGDPGEWTMTPAEIDGALAQRARARLRRGALLPGRQAREGVLGVPRARSRPSGKRAPSTTSTAPGARRARARPLAAHERGAPDGRGHDPAQGSERQPRPDARVRRARASASPGCRTIARPTSGRSKRLAMIEAAGRLRIPFTTGILVGIGETRRERVESLLAIRRAPPQARPRPGGHRAELPRRARRADGARARARRRRGDVRGGDGAPRPRRRRLACRRRPT